jgi:hypothetical protein
MAVVGRGLQVGRLTAYSPLRKPRALDSTLWRVCRSCSMFRGTPSHDRQWSMRDCNLLSNLSVLAPNAASGGVQGAGGLRSAPRRGPPAYQALEPWHGPPRIGCTPTRCDGAPRGWPSIPWLGPAPEATASRCRWILRRGSSTRFGGGTSVAPPSQERPTPAGRYGAAPAWRPTTSSSRSRPPGREDLAGRSRGGCRVNRGLRIVQADDLSGGRQGSDVGLRPI